MLFIYRDCQGNNKVFPMLCAGTLLIHLYKMKTNRWYRLLHENVGMEDT